eukprot:11707-Heterococcus_DN1.PRE.1
MSEGDYPSVKQFRTVAKKSQGSRRRRSARQKIGSVLTVGVIFFDAAGDSKMTNAASDESLVSTESSKRKLAEGEEANQQPSPQVLDEAAVRADRKRRRCVKAANSVTCLAQGVQQLLSAPALIPNTELTLQAAGDLPRLLKQNIFEVLRLNMRDMYENAQGWGWDGEGKWEELFAPEARYLICQQTEEPHA